MNAITTISAIIPPVDIGLWSSRLSFPPVALLGSVMVVVVGVGAVDGVKQSVCKKEN